MKKILIISAVFLTGCYSYDLPVQVVGTSNVGYSTQSYPIARTEPRPNVTQNYNQNNEQNYKLYQHQRSVSCSLGVGVDDAGNACSEDQFFQAYENYHPRVEMEITCQSTCCECE
ncbi:MAG: hypothetical protein LBR35_02585 [Rickettsiales bacterium]|jgi:hypothetical protein|nr:hypothetical protein [Rickettsiales bacterium]